MEIEIDEKLLESLTSKLSEKKIEKTKVLLSDLYSRAIAAAAFSYSPYSRLAVGAAILTAEGKIFTGTNIENRSFGLTNCAERTAIFKAVSVGQKRIVAVAISAPKSDLKITPCGACRQVLSEFADKDAIVMFGRGTSKITTATLAELFPFDSLRELAE